MKMLYRSLWISALIVTSLAHADAEKAELLNFYQKVTEEMKAAQASTGLYEYLSQGKTRKLLESRLNAMVPQNKAKAVYAVRAKLVFDQMEYSDFADSASIVAALTSAQKRLAKKIPELEKISATSTGLKSFNEAKVHQELIERDLRALR